MVDGNEMTSKTENVSSGIWGIWESVLNPDALKRGRC